MEAYPVDIVRIFDRQGVAKGRGGERAPEVGGIARVVVLVRVRGQRALVPRDDAEAIASRCPIQRDAVQRTGREVLESDDRRVRDPFGGRKPRAVTREGARAEGPGVVAYDVRLGRAIPAERIGEEGTERAGDLGSGEEDGDVPGLPLDEVIPVHPSGLPALQRFEREGRVVEQERVEQRVRRGERSSAVQVDRAGNRVVGLVDVALEHPRRVAVEKAEYAQAAGNPQVEQRIGGGGRRHPEARARGAGLERGIRKRHADQLRACQGRREDRVRADTPDRELLAILDGLGADAVDLERGGHTQRVVSGSAGFVEIRRSRPDHRRPRVHADDMPGVVHRGDGGITTRPDEADVGNPLRVPRCDHLPGGGLGRRVSSADQDPETRHADVHGGISLGRENARRERRRTEQHCQRGAAAEESHGSGPGAGGPNLYGAVRPGYDDADYRRPRRFRSTYLATTASAARSGGTSSTSTPARRMRPSASSRARSSSSAAALRNASCAARGRNAATWFRSGFWSVTASGRWRGRSEATFATSASEANRSITSVNNTVRARLRLRAAR